MITYKFQRGATILLALDAVTGNPGNVDAITATMRQVEAPHASVQCNVQARGATNDNPPGWTITADSSNLAMGRWLVDARLVIGAAVIVTDPGEVMIAGSASGGAP